VSTVDSKQNDMPKVHVTVIPTVTLIIADGNEEKENKIEISRVISLSSTPFGSPIVISVGESKMSKILLKVNDIVSELPISTNREADKLVSTVSYQKGIEYATS